jgi:hypothetical protein
MTQLSAACTFLLGKPLAHVHDGAGAQAIGIATTVISFNTKDFDTDGMWASGTNNRLTVQTPGWYKVRYGVSTSAVVGVTMNHSLRATTGPNNPAGNGIVGTQHWAGYNVIPSAGGVGAGGASGIWPFYLYIGDFLQVTSIANATGASTDTTVATSFIDMEFVSA